MRNVVDERDVAWEICGKVVVRVQGVFRVFLKALAQLILRNVDTLENNCVKRGVDAPSLDDPYNAGTEFPQDDQEVYKAVTVVVAAAQQLIHTIRQPQTDLFLSANGYIASALMRCAVELNIPEILNEAGPNGLHVNDIAIRSKSDPEKLGPILRGLASNWIFKEIEPDVFVNNRLSSVLDKGQSVDTLQKNPSNKYAKAEGALAAVICHLTDEGAKAASSLYETLADPTTAFSSEPNKCSFTRAFNTELTAFEFFEAPGQEERLSRFGIAMEGSKKLEPPEFMVTGFDWGSLKDGSLVVDVGGGIGSVSMAVAKAFPKLKIVVQDRPDVVVHGKKRWEEQYSEALSSGRVSFQAHDFFKPQPIRNAQVYMMRFIIHDWSDAYALPILRQLREAATPDTKLFIIDKIIPYTCRPTSAAGPVSTIPGLLKPALPSPITNMGGSSNISHLSNILMMLYGNAKERTIDQFIRLFTDAGWRIVKVHQFEALGEFSSQILAVPM